MFRNTFQNQTLLIQTCIVVVVLKIWNLREYFNISHLRSLLSFWLATDPTLAGILLLTVVVILWKRKKVIELGSEWRDIIKKK